MQEARVQQYAAMHEMQQGMKPEVKKPEAPAAAAASKPGCSRSTQAPGDGGGCFVVAAGASASTRMLMLRDAVSLRSRALNR